MLWMNCLMETSITLGQGSIRCYEEARSHNNLNHEDLWGGLTLARLLLNISGGIEEKYANKLRRMWHKTSGCFSLSNFSETRLCSLQLHVFFRPGSEGRILWFIRFIEMQLWILQHRIETVRDFKREVHLFLLSFQGSCVLSLHLSSSLCLAELGGAVRKYTRNTSEKSVQLHTVHITN